DLLAAIERAQRGEQWLSPVATQPIHARLAAAVQPEVEQIDLGARELEILRRSEEHTSELQSLTNLVCRLLLEKKKTSKNRRKLKAKQTAKKFSSGVQSTISATGKNRIK